MYTCYCMSIKKRQTYVSDSIRFMKLYLCRQYKMQNNMPSIAFKNIFKIDK